MGGKTGAAQLGDLVGQDLEDSGVLVADIDEDLLGLGSDDP